MLARDSIDVRMWVEYCGACNVPVAGGSGSGA